MTASRNYFPFPLQLGALDWFCHPRPGHVFERPAWWDGEAVAGNGYIALRAHRGHWMASDFPAAEGEFLERCEALGWDRFEGLTEDWMNFDDVRGHLYRHAPIYPWTEAGKCAPSPVWRVGGAFLGRLSHLQLIARLPRCEVHVGRIGPDSPMLFRFSGGRGMLAADKRLTISSFSIFEPMRHEDGARVGKRMVAPPGWVNPAPSKFEGWPPADETEFL
jgi:hypothetical protein